MIAQYTAAALVSENKVLAHPASVDSIPTSANKEDHVSMGTIAARKCRSVVANAEHVLAIELLCGCQALDLLTRGEPGRLVEIGSPSAPPGQPNASQSPVRAKSCTISPSSSLVPVTQCV